MRKDKHISISLETVTYNNLVALAKADRRNVSNMVRYIIKLYIRGVQDETIQLSTHNVGSRLSNL